MQLTNQQTLAAPQMQVWNALNNVDILQACIPGCEALTLVDTNMYELQVLAAIGPVKARFKGKLQLTDLQAPNSYVIRFEGQGGAAGHGKGTAQVSLTPSDPNTTVLQYTATATVGGKIAQIGQRLVDMAAQRMAAEFFSNFDRAIQLTEDTPEVMASGSASRDEPKQNYWDRLRRWWLNLFRKST